MLYDDLTDDQRATFILAQIYEKCRKEKQHGYRVLPRELNKVTAEDFENRVMRTFGTVRKWLEDKGWHVSLSEVHWQGYVRFVFKEFEPQIPQPGQLKNEVLFKRHFSESIVDVVPERTNEELSEIYRRVIRTEILENDEIMKRLGLM